MTNIPTLYSNYQELMLDLDIFGKIISTPQQSISELETSLFEEFKRRRPFPTMETKRYELSDLVSDDYIIEYNKELELQDDESILDLSSLRSSTPSRDDTDIDYTSITPDIENLFSYQSNVKDSDRLEILSKYNIETGEDFNLGVHQTEKIFNSVKEDSSLILTDEEIENLPNSNNSNSDSDEVIYEVDDDVDEYDSFSSDYEDEDDYDEDDDISYEFSSSDNDEDDSTEEEFTFEDDSDTEEDEYDFDDENTEEEFSEEDDLVTEEKFSEEDDLVENEDEYDSSEEDEYDDFSSSEEDEYDFDNEDDIESDEDEYDFEEDTSEEDSSDEDEYDDFDSVDSEEEDEEEFSFDEDTITEDTITESIVTEEANEEEFSFDENTATEVDEVTKESNKGVLPSQEQTNSVTDDSSENTGMFIDFDDDSDMLDDISFEEEVKVKEQIGVSGSHMKDSSHIGESPPLDIPPAPVNPIPVPVEEEKIDRSAEPTDIRQFLRKHPRCEYSFALKYFTKKQLSDALKIGKIIKKGNILKLP